MDDGDMEKPEIIEEIGVLEGQKSLTGLYFPSSLEELRELFRPIERE